MQKTTNNIPDALQVVSDSLLALQDAPSFENGLKAINAITRLLRVDADLSPRPFNDSRGRIRDHAGWFMEAHGFGDRRACYKFAEDNDKNLDIKIYWVQYQSKRVISTLVALTPNFEDEVFYTNERIGIDFIIPKTADRILIALSKNYTVRTLELQGGLSLTQQEILSQWFQPFDFSNKAQVHQILWKSLDFQPLNKRFYQEITRFFAELKQHFVKESIFDEKHAALFTNRLIGRLIFCWFLRKKGVISEKQNYFTIGSENSTAYYVEKLERLFFEVLNTPINERERFTEERRNLFGMTKGNPTLFAVDDETPFLNGGLFEPRPTDYYGESRIKFPADFFHRFFEFLGRYNFTTDESSSSFQQVAIDPEMLGRIFENLLAEQIEDTGEQAKKAKGAFYTNREIVDYMCRESLRAHLTERLPNDERREKILGLLFDKKEHEFDTRNDRATLAPYKKEIMEVLDLLKALDPACGSGAFPMGMLQLMLGLYERLEARFDPYKTKLQIIKNNLYGVDIEPMAVEISRLRAWLSILVDEELNPKAKNMGIEPLPNLDFKFVCANSLIPLEHSGSATLGEDIELDKKMQSVRDEYFATQSVIKKKKLRADFERLLNKNDSLFGYSTKHKQLQTYKPFDSENSCAFFDPEFMFGVDKFDIIIANPPYVSFYSRESAKTENNSNDIQALRRNSVFTKYEKKTGRLNLWMFFVEKFITLLKDAGISAFIVDVNFTKDVARDIRRYLLENVIVKEFIHELSEFENVASGQVIIIIQKGTSSNHIIIKRSLNEIGVSIDQATILPPKFNFWNQDTSPLIDKLSQMSKLKDINDIELTTGVQIGGTEKYKGVPVKDYFYRKEWDYKTVFPSVSIKSVQRYCVPVSEKGILFDYNLATEITKNTKKSAIVLSKYKEFLGKTKIYIRQSAPIIIATLGEPNTCGEYSLFSLTSSSATKLKYILGLLNSKLISYFALQKGIILKKKGTQPQIRKNGLEDLPILAISDADQKPFTEIVDKILAITSKPDYDHKNPPKEQKVLESEIDQMVYKLYGLNSEEIKIIEAN